MKRSSPRMAGATAVRDRLRWATSGLLRSGLTSLLLLALLALLASSAVHPAVASIPAAYSAEELAVLRLINEYREENGLVPLLLSDTVSDACTKNNLDMGKYGYEGHITQASDYFPVGSTAWDRMRICGYDYNTYKGEIIGYGYASAEGVFQGWKASPPHNAAMLGSAYRVAGVSMDVVPGSRSTNYWTVDFGGVVDPSAHDPSGSPSTTTTTTTVSTTTTTLPHATTTTPPPTSTTLPATTTTTLPASRFVDVSPGNPFYVEITALAASSVVSGYPDHTFRPNAAVTRAQFAKIIMLAIGKHTDALDGVDSPAFSDVVYTGQAYPFDFVQEAASLGIVKGSGSGTFGPDLNLTRAQLTLVLVRAGGDRLVLPPAGTAMPFVDVPGYLKEAVATALYNGLLSGTSQTTFAPYRLATRGQVAKMVYYLVERLRS